MAGPWLLQIELSNGQVRWERSWPQAHAGRVMADTQGNVYVSVFLGSNQGLWSFDTNGAQRWIYRSGSGFRAELLAVASGTVIAQESGSAGERRTFIGANTGVAQFSTIAVVPGEENIVVGGQFALSTSPLQGDVLNAIDWRHGAVSSFPLGAVDLPYWPVLTLTSHETLLLPIRTSLGLRLRAYDSQGTQTLDCGLPLELDPSVASLTDGHWISLVGGTVTSFSLPGHGPAEKGWVAHRGGGSREGRHR